MGSNNWKLANKMASVSSRFKLSEVSGFSVLETRKGLDVLSSRIFSFPTSHTMSQGGIQNGIFGVFFTKFLSHVFIEFACLCVETL